jgi:hypothetical protein
MDKYRQLSEDDPRNNLGYTLIQWVKRVHDKKAYKNNESVNGHSTITHYSNLISYEVKGIEGLERKANIW